ncbi:MAG TPA: SRPBCC domain-containing protein, partial [bacterium]
MSTRIDNPTEELVEQELVITRIFDAPRRRVFKAWTEPEQMKRWWGPKGFTT